MLRETKFTARETEWLSLAHDETRQDKISMFIESLLLVRNLIKQ